MMRLVDERYRRIVAGGSLQGGGEFEVEVKIDVEIEIVRVVEVEVGHVVALTDASLGAGWSRRPLRPSSQDAYATPACLGFDERAAAADLKLVPLPPRKDSTSPLRLLEIEPWTVARVNTAEASSGTTIVIDPTSTAVGVTFSKTIVPAAVSA